MQLIRATTSTAGTGNRNITVPANGNVYSLDVQGRVLVSEADLPWFLAQGFTPAQNYVADLFANSGVIASGTASVTVGILPANFYIRDIILQNLTGNAITGGINIGSTAGGSDVVSALAVGANALTVVADASILKRALSTTARTPLFVSAASSWNGANLNCKAVLRPF